MRYVAEAAPTPAELIERLRLQLGENGRALSDDRLAELVGAPTRQQIIGWRKHGRGMSRRYAERFAELDGEHTAEDYMRQAPQLVLDQEAILDRLARIDDAILQLVQVASLREATTEARLDRMLDLVASQLEAQSTLLERLAEVAARLEAGTDQASRGRG